MYPIVGLLDYMAILFCVCVGGGVTFLKMLLAGSLVEYGIKGSSVQFSPLVVSDSL